MKVEDRVGEEINAVHARIGRLVQIAMPINDGGPQSTTPKREQEAAMQQLVTEGITSLVVLAGSVASIGASLRDIHAELVKANQPDDHGLMHKG